MFKFKSLLPAFIIYYIATLNLIRYTAATSVKSLCSAVTIILHVFYYLQLYSVSKKKKIGAPYNLSVSVFIPGNSVKSFNIYSAVNSTKAFSGTMSSLI